MKEIRLRPRTADHDLRRLVVQAKKFLRKGNMVKISIIFISVSSGSKTKARGRMLPPTGTAASKSAWVTSALMNADPSSLAGTVSVERRILSIIIYNLLTLVYKIFIK